jgi:hypothetical protein
MASKANNIYKQAFNTTSFHFLRILMEMKPWVNVALH